MSRLTALNETEVSMFAEFISRHIHERIYRLHLACSNDIERASKKLILYVWSDLDLVKKTQAGIVQRYASAAKDLIDEIQCMTSDFFQMDAADIPRPALTSDIYGFHINTRLVKAYYHTERLANLMEKIIDQTLNMVFFDRLNSPLVKTVVEPLSPGGIMLSVTGLDIYSHMAANKKDITRRLKGISKNISLRLTKTLSAHYAGCVYAIADEQLRDALEEVG